MTSGAENQVTATTDSVSESYASLRVRFAQTNLEKDAFELNLSLSIPQQGITAIVGPSGCGKTTLLRAIAGLEKAEGEIKIHNQLWQDQHICLPVHRRRLGYVFQEASLFPHLTVEQNILFGIKRAANKKQSAASAEETAHLTQLLGIQSLLHRYPHQLSGGQQQRVAIARAVLTKPDILLMDEPLAALDSEKKQEILGWLEKLKQELDIPVLYVTHSQQEVARLADEVVLMENGKIKQQGSLKSMFSSLQMPNGFSDEPGVIIEAQIAEIDHQYHLMRANFAGGDFWLQQSEVKLHSTIRLRILARDVSLALSKNTDSSILNVLPTTVTEIKTDESSPIALVKLSIGHDVIIARITRRSLQQLGIRIGMQVYAQVKSVALVR